MKFSLSVSAFFSEIRRSIIIARINAPERIIGIITGPPLTIKPHKPIFPSNIFAVFKNENPPSA
jgi:hypothetical protein